MTLSQREKILLFVIIVLCVALSGTIYVSSQKSSQFVFEDDGENNKQNGIKEAEEVIQEPKLIGIHIGGQVKNPGFIWIEDGKRLCDALYSVGGALPEADLDAVNLSKKLIDEEKIYIPQKGEIVGTAEIGLSNMQGDVKGGSISTNGKVDINTATQSELDTLPGIGETLAKRILDYRSTNGPFKSIEDIRNVSGIGQKRYDDIKDLITVK